MVSPDDSYGATQAPVRGEPATNLLTASRRDMMVRRAKVGVLQARRLWRWATAPAAWQRPAMAGSADYPHCVYHRELALGRSDPGVDRDLDQGKRINVALAAPHFEGLILSPAQPLSFWRVLGRCTPARGFRPGMELRGGCIVPAVGGGLCLLSNALFRMGCELGWTIIERHGHTMEAVPPVPDEPVWGLDATVLWPHVDLRMAPQGQVRLSVKVRTALHDDAAKGRAKGIANSLAEGLDRLIVQVHSRTPVHVDVALASTGDATYRRGSERVRANQVVRQVRDRNTGRMVMRDVVAINRRRLLYTHEQRRNCFSCGEQACVARPRSLLRAYP